MVNHLRLLEVLRSIPLIWDHFEDFYALHPGHDRWEVFFLHDFLISSSEKALLEIWPAGCLYRRNHFNRWPTPKGYLGRDDVWQTSELLRTQDWKSVFDQVSAYSNASIFGDGTSCTNQRLIYSKHFFSQKNCWLIGVTKKVVMPIDLRTAPSGESNLNHDFLSKFIVISKFIEVKK